MFGYVVIVAVVLLARVDSEILPSNCVVTVRSGWVYIVCYYYCDSWYYYCYDS
jgi:hypothetical protein